jgi:hypothetical protein
MTTLITIRIEVITEKNIIFFKEKKNGNDKTGASLMAIFILTQVKVLATQSLD